VVAPAIKKALDDPKGPAPADPSLARYAGRYQVFTAGERIVLPWDDGLAVLVARREPAWRLVQAEVAGGHCFRRARADGTLGGRSCSRGRGRYADADAPSQQLRSPCR
jgi:hypothetical protein